MSDREEREEHIKRLEAALACEEKQSSGKCAKQSCDDNCALLYEQGNWGEWKETLRYAINSLKIDLKYDLLYEETIEQSDKQADKPTTKNDLGVDAISRKAVQTRLKEIINEMETIFADIREREVDDSVCGLCEYDCDHGVDGFANECPGFEKDDCFKLNEKYRAEWLDISNLPSVSPQEPRCKDCKWWKDSDGEYRRGCGAESQCPINRREVFEGNGYCYMFEPQESEG